ncbi:nucleoporin 2 [Labeo rohita]|uniref:Nucleoporin 2 n=1 Tax=Labeo rohita TaxID=84645 RepID=A0A498M9H7_LABRO|nr:nucleoporin 2 [Labeo rohita]
MICIYKVKNDGFGNRVWINPSQRTGGEFIQPSSFSRGGNDDWSRGGGGGGGGGGTSRDVRSSDFSFSNQNRFSALSSHSHSDKGGQKAVDDNANYVDTIQKDMEIWQTSGQWPFSCYSALKGRISGFVELSPEELRLEYYNGRASGDLQAYMNSIQQLANQWRSRVQEMRTMSSSTQMSVISELNNPSSPTSTHGFGSTGSGFGSSASGFGSSASSSGFGAGGFGSASQSSSTFSFAPSKAGFGASNTQQASGFGSDAFAQPSSGFGASAPSVASFSFAPQATENKASATAFSSASTFSFKTSSGGLGTEFRSSAPANSGGGFGQSSASSAFSGGADAGHSADSLFTPQSDLTAEELKEFSAKRFTLGQIPLKPPPADLLMV